MQRKFGIAVAMIVVLLLLSVVMISSDSANADNSETVIKLYENHSGDTRIFNVHNMHPGDVKTKYYTVNISHLADVRVCFKSEIIEQTDGLADIINIIITNIDNNTILYDGTLADMDKNGYEEKFGASVNKETTAYYKVEMVMPETADSKYQKLRLMADLCWYVKDKDELIDPQPNNVINISLWILLIGGLFGLAFMLLISRKKAEDECLDEDE